MADENTNSEILRRIVEEVSRPPTVDEARRFACGLIHAAAQRADRYRTAVRPIWKKAAKGLPTHVGSCVLATIGSGRFILTAAHVADHADGTVLYIGLDGLRTLPPAFVRSPLPPGRDRSSDLVDFAYMPFPEELVGHIGDATFIPEEAIGVREPVEDQVYACLGYPNARNRDPRWHDTAVRGELMGYTGVGRPLALLPGRAAPGVHILVDRSPYVHRTPDGGHKRAAQARGYSGGAIFAVARSGTATGLMVPTEPRLAAIYIEAHKPERVIVGTRVDFAIPQLVKVGGT